MTKLRWENPPSEPDPAKYDPRTDSTLRRLGRGDRHRISERQKVLNRLSEVRDQLSAIENNDASPPHSNPGHVRDEDLEEFTRLNTFDPSLSIDLSPGAEAVLQRMILALKDEKAYLEERLAQLPRQDRF